MSLKVEININPYQGLKLANFKDLDETLALKSTLIPIRD